MYYIGIDLGGTNIACGIVDVNGKLLTKKSCKTGADRPVDEIMSDMAKLVEDTVLESGFAKEKIEFLGVAAPGIANSDTGVIEYSCNLPSFLNFNIVEDLKKRTGIA